MAPKRRRTGKPVAGTSSSVFWRGDMLGWVLARQRVCRALLTGGAVQQDLVEIVGPLQEGDTVLLRGSEEIREGPA